MECFLGKVSAFPQLHHTLAQRSRPADTKARWKCIYKTRRSILSSVRPISVDKLGPNGRTDAGAKMYPTLFKWKYILYLVNKPFLSRTTSSIFFSLRASGSMVNSLASSHTGFRLAFTVSVFRFLTRSGRRRILTNGSGRSGCFAAKYNHFVQQQIWKEIQLISLIISLC